MAEIYENTFLDYASKLDALTDSCCKISDLATLFCKSQTDESIILLSKKILEIKESYNTNKKIKIISREFYDSFIKLIGHNKISQIVENKIK